MRDGRVLEVHEEGDRAGLPVIVHGPVILPVDDSAATRFARAQRLRELRRLRMERAA